MLKRTKFGSRCHFFRDVTQLMHNAAGAPGASNSEDQMKQEPV